MLRAAGLLALRAAAAARAPPAACPDAAPGLVNASAVFAGRLRSGGDVTLPNHTAVRWDVSPAAPLGWVTVPASSALVFADDGAPRRLAAAAVVVAGRLQAGAPGCPFRGRLDIDLVGGSGDARRPVGGDGHLVTTKALVVLPGGKLLLHAAPVLSWARAARSAAAGSSELTLDADPEGWLPGGAVAVASAGFDAADAQRLNITSVSGRTVRLASPLRRAKYGNAPAARRVLNTEIALLSRRIRVRGVMDTICPDMDPFNPAANAGLEWERDCFGGHSLFLRQSDVRIDAVEFAQMGQANIMGRYPVHWHMAGPSYGSYVRSSAVHSSFQRCVTVHGTFGVEVEDNVCFDTKGHGFFLEDAIEYDNVLRRNVAMAIHPGPLLCSDNPIAYEYGADISRSAKFAGPDRGPSGFWLTNMNNTIEDNVAAGVGGKLFGHGFWLALPTRVFDPSASFLRSHAGALGIAEWVFAQQPNAAPFRRFAGNVAHSCYHGVEIDGVPLDSEPVAGAPDGRTCAPQGSGRFRPAPAPAVLEGLVVHKNRMGVWLDGDNFVINASLFADNAHGMLFEINADYNGKEAKEVSDVAFIGETDNQYPEKERPACVHQLAPPGECARFALRGMNLYDGPVCLRGLTHANYTFDGVRNASVFNHFEAPMDYVNPFSVRGVRAAADSMPSSVYFFSNTTPAADGSLVAVNGATAVGAKTPVVYDLDSGDAGNVTSTVANNPLLVDDRCALDAAANAYRCRGVLHSRMMVTLDGVTGPGAAALEWTWWRSRNAAWNTTVRGPLTNLNTIAGDCVVGSVAGSIAAAKRLFVQGWWLAPGQVLRGGLFIGHDVEVDASRCHVDGPDVVCTEASSAAAAWGQENAFYNAGGWLYWSLAKGPDGVIAANTAMVFDLRAPAGAAAAAAVPAAEAEAACPAAPAAPAAAWWAPAACPDAPQRANPYLPL